VPPGATLLVGRRVRRQIKLGRAIGIGISLFHWRAHFHVINPESGEAMIAGSSDQEHQS